MHVCSAAEPSRAEQSDDALCASPSREGGRCAEMAMVCLTDFEEYAKEHLSKATWDYYAAGADECCTRDDNLLAYKRYSRVPAVWI